MDLLLDYFANPYFDIVLIYHYLGIVTFIFNFGGIWVIAPTMICYVLPLAWMLSAIMFNIWVPLNQVFSDVACIGMACQSTACISSAIFLNRGSRNYLKAAWQRIVKHKVVEYRARIVTVTELGSQHVVCRK
ncbi:unnamed protein product, partial [Mesorhabditis spiculigera]